MDYLDKRSVEFYFYFWYLFWQDPLTKCGSEGIGGLSGYQYISFVALLQT